MSNLGVVVPIYNAEPYLEQCINSILNQSYSDLTVVLVDDGSNDKSCDICDWFKKKDNRVKVIHQKNQGKLLARYNGVRELDCKYVTFVDADDWIDCNTYMKMKKYMDDQLDVISFQIIRYYDETTQRVTDSMSLMGKYDEQEIRENIFPIMIWDDEKGSCGLDPSLANKIVKKELVEQALFRAKHLDISYGDDVVVIYPLMLQARTVLISDECLYYHRKRKENEVAPYFADKNFYKKLSKLYDYLRDVLGENYGFIKQLDYFYELSVRTFLRKYGTKKEHTRYMFPFDKIPSGKRIVLYGAGVIGQTFHDQFSRLRYGEIVAWVDQKYTLYTHLGVMAVESIREIDTYDYVIIAIGTPSVAEKVKQNLIAMKVEKEKIVWSV